MSDTIAKLEGVKAIAGYFKAVDVPGIELVPGVTAQFISGKNMMFSLVTIEPGAVVPLHSHPHEQAGTVLEGDMLFFMNSTNPEDGRRMGPGDYYVATGGTPHSATTAGNERVIALDIFSPPREDYLALFREKYGREAPGLFQE
jgi:quercetin dioxygenase-like cupin family protein